MNANDQRQEYRLTTELSIFLEVGTNNEQDTAIVISKSLDISANGLRVITDCALPEGNILRASVQSGDGMQRFTLITEVKWSRAWEHEGEFLVGLALFESDNSSIQEWKEYVAHELKK